MQSKLPRRFHSHLPWNIARGAFINRTILFTHFHYFEKALRLLAYNIQYNSCKGVSMARILSSHSLAEWCCCCSQLQAMVQNTKSATQKKQRRTVKRFTPYFTTIPSEMMQQSHNILKMNCSSFSKAIFPPTTLIAVDESQRHVDLLNCWCCLGRSFNELNTITDGKCAARPSDESLFTFQLETL